MRLTPTTKPTKPQRRRPRKRLEPNEDNTMDFSIQITGFVALYIFMLAAFAGWVIIGHVPAILHTPLMSGSNFVHGIAVVGGMFALLNASTMQEQAIGSSAGLLGAGNAAGRHAGTERMLAMCQASGPAVKHRKSSHTKTHRPKAV